MSAASQTGAGERIVLTGATGFLGQQIVKVLLQSRPDARLSLLVRESPGHSAAQRLDALLERCCPVEAREAARRRVEVYPSDIRAERCGLSDRDWAALTDGVTRVIHGAASVRFDMTLEEARSINTGGARNLLELASATHRRGTLRSFAYISTAFVAGRRTGLVREDELEAGQQFRNTYERSKCEAEAQVRARGADLPAMILRPSVVVGDSRTGATTGPNALYWALQAYAQRRWRIVPGRAGTVVDMVPVEFVARAAAFLALESRAVGRCFHLCAGAGRSATIGEIADSAARFFQVQPPRFIDPVLFDVLLRPLLLLTVWGKRRRVLRQGKFYSPYFDMRLEFDTSQAEALLAPAGIHRPRVMEYLERLFAYCLATDFGRRPPVEETVR